MLYRRSKYGAEKRHGRRQAEWSVRSEHGTTARFSRLYLRSVYFAASTASSKEMERSLEIPFEPMVTP